MSALHPSRRNLKLVTKSSRPKLCRDQDGYFLLFFISRIATINNATVKITINSSYVLISIILSTKLGTDESTSPNYPGKYIIFANLLKLEVPIWHLKFHYNFSLFKCSTTDLGLNISFSPEE